MSATPNINGEKIKGSITGITLFSATTISGGTFYGDGSNLTGISELYVTGFSYINNTFTISQNSGSTFSSLINTMTGLTINGNLSVTGYTIVGGQLVTLGGNSVTNPTYRTSLGGGNLSPRATFGIESVGASNHRYSFDPVNQNGLVLTVANNGSVYIARAGISVIASGGIGSEIGTMVFNTLNGSDYSERMRINNLGNVGINNTSPSEKLDVVGKTKTTNIQITSGATNGYVLTSDSSGNGTWQQVPSFTGGTVTGATNFTNGLTANTISATTYQNLPIDVFVTGGTYNNGTGTATFTNNIGGTFNVSGFSTSSGSGTFTGGTVTGATNFTNGLTANTISATTYFNLPTDIRVTGATYNNNTFTYTNNTGGTFSVLFNTVTGLTVNGNLSVTGNTNVRGLTGTSALISGSAQSVLTVVGSGTTLPVFSVQGSSGELFSVTDSLIGSLFSVNDISGLPILEAFSDNTILMGNYLAPSLNTTTRVSAGIGTTNIYSIPTSAYTGAFFDYTVSDGTNLRAGNIMSVWSASSTVYSETSTTDIGNTSGITFNTTISGGNAILRASGTTTGWTVKVIVRSI